MIYLSSQPFFLMTFFMVICQPLRHLEERGEISFHQ